MDAKPDRRYLDAWVLGWLEPDGAVDSLPEQAGLMLFAKLTAMFPEASFMTAPELRSARRWAALAERFAAGLPGGSVLTMLRAGLFDNALGSDATANLLQRFRGDRRRTGEGPDRPGSHDDDGPGVAERLPGVPHGDAGAGPRSVPGRVAAAEPEFAPQVGSAFAALEARRPSFGHRGWVRVLYENWSRLPNLFDSEREEIERKLADLDPDEGDEECSAVLPAGRADMTPVGSLQRFGRVTMRIDGGMIMCRAARSGGPTDLELLARHAAGDGEAFTELVRRHGPLVQGVCRRALADAHDAEDAAQATFLVLARKAGSGRWQESVANWLHATARRVAANAARAARRRRLREERAAVPEVIEPIDRMTARELFVALDEELARLPGRGREAVILCCLEGLTHDEAAARLGLTATAVKGRVQRGRSRLAEALKRRGLDLGGVLLAARAAMPARAAVPAVGPQPAGWGVKPVSAAVLIAAGLIAAAAADPTPAPSKKARQADAVTYAGRVIDQDGKPVAAAKVYYYVPTRDAEPCPVRAKTGAAGRFRFTIARKDAPVTADAIGADPLKDGVLVAKAAGATFAWSAVGDEPVTLRVARGVKPVTGRVVNTEGKPVAGATVTALGVFAPRGDSLTPFLEALKGGEAFYPATGHLPSAVSDRYIWHRPVPFLPAVKTDPAGRFRLAGFAPERLIKLRVEAPAVETCDLYMATRAGFGRLGPKLHRPLDKNDKPRTVSVLPAGSDIVTVTGLTVVGTVRGAKSDQPVANALVESYRLAGTNLIGNVRLRTRTDAAGRFRLVGLPRGAGNRIRVHGGPAAPHVPKVVSVPAGRLFAPSRVDVKLEPGVWLDVAAVDKPTGRPAPGRLGVFVMPGEDDDPNFPPPAYQYAFEDMKAIPNDGNCRLAVPARRCVIAFRAEREKYPIAFDAPGRRLPSSVTSSNYHAFADIDPEFGKGPVKIRFALDAGRSVDGRVVGPDGKPLRGVLAGGLRHHHYTDSDGPLPTDRFRALSLGPDRPRRVGFVHEGRKLAGFVTLTGREKSPVVRLKPWATVKGRLVGRDGKPVTGRVYFTDGMFVEYRTAYSPTRDPKLTEGGSFTAEGLIPGMKYTLRLVDERKSTFGHIVYRGTVFRDIVLKPGEVRDLGTVRPGS